MKNWKIVHLRCLSDHFLIVTNSRLKFFHQLFHIWVYDRKISKTLRQQSYGIMIDEITWFTLYIEKEKRKNGKSNTVQQCCVSSLRFSICKRHYSIPIFFRMGSNAQKIGGDIVSVYINIFNLIAIYTKKKLRKKKSFDNRILTIRLSSK